MKLRPIPIKRALNKAYRKEKILRAEIEAFKAGLRTLLERLNTEESEENAKNHLRDFLNHSWYHDKHLIATKGRADMVIHTDSKAGSPVGVLFEVKRPRGKTDPQAADMISLERPNAKALHELILYYFRERTEHRNTDLKYLVITDIYRWFVFDAADFDKLFYQNRRLRKDFEGWRQGRKTQNTTEFFYQEIARPFVESLEAEMPCTAFDLRDFERPLFNDEPKDDDKLIPLYKILSPTHLLRLPFANDSNSLNKDFYRELLHLIGLEEGKENNKKVIQRKPAGQREPGALLENTIAVLESEGRLGKIPRLSSHGGNREEQLFNIALELAITWINRILFLKLLEAQLLKYHQGDPAYRFLNSRFITDFDELNELFFDVLARQPSERPAFVREKFRHIPYLNSSLFEISELEDATLRINSLKDRLTLPLMNGTVLRDAQGRRRSGELKALDYLFSFLDAYDFSSEGSEAIQEENKTLINASVLGLIFEKINGYRDGSFFTPGFITMYMCRETLRRAVVQKFRESPRFAEFEGDSFAGLANYLGRKYDPDDLREANRLVNSIKVCDPAVGYGHFLVSSLNELIAIKSELGILLDRDGKLLPVRVEVENDELTVSWRHNDELFEYRPGLRDSQLVQETLFHEKQTLIENCLFGVDINPNSVKICRLRLWIELLKNAYYKVGSGKPEGGKSKIDDQDSKIENDPASPVCYADAPELQEEYRSPNPAFRLPNSALETLPNIDINIKQGNSLVSRFEMDENLSAVLKKSKWSIGDYRLAVSSYQHATSKEEKQELLRLINTIKDSFQTHIHNRDPRFKQLSKLRGQRALIENKAEIGDLFDKLKDDDIAEDLTKLDVKISKLEAEIEEIKNAAIYGDAFEWRFEFPEVLDEDGNFVGFDVVVGNPPYIPLEEMVPYERQYLKKNYPIFERKYETSVVFIGRGLNILSSVGILSYIAPITWQTGSNFEKFREFLFKEKSVDRIINLPFNIFEDAYVETAIYFLGNKHSTDFYEIFIFDKKESAENLQNLKFSEIDKDLVSPPKYKVILNPFVFRILQRLEMNNLELIPLGEITISTQGLSPSRFPKAEGKNPNNYPYLADGNVYNYLLIKKETFLTDLSDKESLKKYYEAEPKLLIRRIVNRQDRLDVGYTDEKLVFKKDINPFIVIDERFNTRYILALLASKFISFLYVNVSSIATKDDFRQTTLTELREIPIPVISIDKQAIFTKKVDEILRLKTLPTTPPTAPLEAEIDLLVYKLYGLSWEEVKVVDPEFGLTEEEYDNYNP